MNTVRSLNTVESVDSWTDTRWQLRSMSAAINSLMVPDGVNTNMFRLRAVPPQGKVAYYEVSFEGNLMADCWKECKFFPRGDRPLQPPALTAGLSADPTDDELQQAVAASAPHRSASPTSRPIPIWDGAPGGRYRSARNQQPTSDARLADSVPGAKGAGQQASDVGTHFRY